MTLREEISELSGRELAMLSVGVVIISLILHPFQLGLVRLLEGYWGQSVAGMALSAIGVELEVVPALVDLGVAVPHLSPAVW
jgi:hypothetical protein